MGKRKIFFTLPNSMAIDLEPPIAVVCHDAGAANIIISWMAAKPQAGWRAVMRGPAYRIWTEQTSPGVQFGTIEEALDGASMLLSGTGWASELEHEARNLARQRGIRSIAVIDHWVNYSERFERNGSVVLPDKIYVTDEHALENARRCFPDLKIEKKPNLYLESLVQQIDPVSPGCNVVLYLLEPILSDWKGTSSFEFEVLDYFVSMRTKLGIHPEASIRLRAHPSEPEGKYLIWIKANPNLNLEMDESGSLAMAISRCAWVVGAETQAMVVALESGRKVVSSLPPWLHRCRLPQEKIIHLRDLV